MLNQLSIWLVLPAALLLALTGLLLVPKLWRQPAMQKAWHRYGDLAPLLPLVICFYFMPFSPVAPEDREAGSVFVTIYTRFGGLVSIIDLLLLGALAAALWRKLRRRGSANFSLGQPFGPIVFFAIFAIALLLGVLHSHGGLLAYGPTPLRNVLARGLLLAQGLAAYMIVLNCLETRQQGLRFIYFLEWLGFALAAYGVLRALLIAVGYVRTLWPNGLPIVLYDQMAMLWVPIYTFSALYLLRSRISPARGTLVFVMFLLVMISTRKFSYILLFGGVTAIMLLGVIARRWTMLRNARVVGTAAMAFLLFIVALSLMVPRFQTAMMTTFKAVNMASKEGQRHGGRIRLAEIPNTFANLDRRPYAYVTGVGIGTMWQAIHHQPMDQFTKNLGFRSGWYPQVHVPYFAMLYRLGFAGTLLLLLWLFLYANGILRRIKILPAGVWARLVAILVYLLFGLPALIDSANPTGFILAGLYLGALTPFLRQRQLTPAEGDP